MDAREIHARLAGGRRRMAELEDRAAWLDDLAHQLDEDADQAGRLLLDVVTGWTPEVLQGRTAETGHAQLLDQRDGALRAADEVRRLADVARRRAAEARAEVAGLQADAARLQALLAGMDDGA